MTRRVLITGGAGFIGSHVVDAHLATGDEVTVLDDLSSGRRENIPPHARFVQADVRSPEARALLASGGFTMVNHHAAQLDVRRSVDPPEEYELFTQVGSFSRARRRATVDLLLDGRLVDSRSVTLAPGERRSLVFVERWAAAGRLEVVLTGRDDLAVDDRVAAPLPRTITRASPPSSMARPSPAGTAIRSSGASRTA